MKADIIIVGAGIAGCSLALALAQANPNTRITVLEASARLERFSGERFDPRVVALNDQSIQLFEGLGVWDAIIKTRACAYKKMRVWDGEGTGSIEFSAADVHQQSLGYIVENSVALKVLRNQLLDYQNIQWMAPCSVVGVQWGEGCTEVTLESGVSVSADLVIGADGANSKIRNHAQFKTREWSYQQSAIVTTVQMERPHQDAAWQRFTDDGPLAFLPLRDANSADTNYCSIVWSLNKARAAEVETLDDQAFSHALSHAFENRLGKVLWADKRFVIPLNQMHVTEYFKSGIALIGDAAHTIHPLAGQGVNVGLRDVRCLVEEINRALLRQIPLNHISILKRYQRNVQTHNLAAMATMEGFKQLFTQSDPWLRVLRNFGLQKVNQWSGFKRQMMMTAAGLSSKV